MEVYVDDETKLTLHGLQQYYVKLKDQEKNRKLFDLLDVLEFNQVSRCSYSHLRSCCSERRTRIQIGYESVMREYQFWKDIIKKNHYKKPSQHWIPRLALHHEIE